MTNEECYEALCGICETALGRPLTTEECGNAALAAESLVRRGETRKLTGFRDKASGSPGELYRQLIGQIKESWDHNAGTRASETRRKLVDMLHDCKRYGNDDPEDFVLIRIVSEFPDFFLRILRGGEDETE